MSVDADHMGWSGGMLAEIGYLIERAAHAVGPASSTLGRVVAAVAVAKHGARLLPEGARLVRRHPVGALLVLGGCLGALYLLRAPRIPSAPRWG